MVGHSLVHTKVGVEVHHSLHEEGIVRPNGAGGVGSFQVVTLPFMPSPHEGRPLAKEGLQGGRPQDRCCRCLRPVSRPVRRVGTRHFRKGLAFD
jgi:hypothetical protein